MTASGDDRLAETDSVYLCPRSGAPLVRAEGVLRATDGSSEYPIRDDVPVFLSYPAIESTEVAERLDRLNAVAREGDWREAIRQEKPESLRYVTDRRRLAFLDLLPVDKGTSILEIGCSLGQMTVDLAERAGRVSAIDVVEGQARFALERCRQSGLTNVSIACAGDDLRLPFRSGKFDGVILNLVIEWCASRDDSIPFVEGQLCFLDAIYRVLRPGGFFYMCTKNRYALHYVIGRRDEHTGFRFGNALPRWLMLALLKRTGANRPNGLLHSYRWWMETLSLVGYQTMRSFWAVPDMRYPERFIPNDPTSIRLARRKGGFREGAFRSTHLLMRMVPDRLVKHLAPGLCFLATK